MKRWQKLTLRLLLLLSLFLLLRFYFVKLLSFAHEELDVEGAITWMNQNPNLSGWAQFVGAMLAILLAIAIPAWQRHGQGLDRWRDFEDINSSLSQNSYFLLSEVGSHIASFQGSDGIPRALIRNDDIRIDLLRRIHELELREIDHERITRLFRARGAVHMANASVGSVALQNLPLSIDELTSISEQVDKLKLLTEEAQASNRKAIDNRARANLWLLARILYPMWR